MLLTLKNCIFLSGVLLLIFVPIVIDNDYFDIHTVTKYLIILSSYHAPDVYDLTQEQSRNCLQNTRSTCSKPENLRLGTFNSKTFKSFSSVAPETWNSLSNEIQKSNSKSSFKHSYKKLILSKYKERIECKNTRCTDQRYHV